jgi:hypothetical protein
MAPHGKLLAAVTFPRFCGSELHLIRLATYEHRTKSGLSGTTPYTDYLNVIEIDPEAHDVDLEMTLADLGAKKPYCLQAFEAWNTNREKQAILLYSFATSEPQDLSPRYFDLTNRIVLAWGEAIYPVYEAKRGTTTFSAAQAFVEARKFVEGRSTLDQIRWYLSQHYQGRASDNRSLGYETGFSYYPGPSQYADNALRYAAEFVARPNTGQSMSIFVDALREAGAAVRKDATQSVYGPRITEEAQLVQADTISDMRGPAASDLFIRRMISVAIRTMAEWPGWEPWLLTTVEVGRRLEDD